VLIKRWEVQGSTHFFIVNTNLLGDFGTKGIGLAIIDNLLEEAFLSLPKHEPLQYTNTLVHGRLNYKSHHGDIIPQ
jgi:hypothetical protein